MPLVGRANTGAQGVPSEVVEQPVMAAIPLPMMGRMGLPTMLVALTVGGVTQSVITPLTQVEVAAAVTDGSQPGATAASPEASA